MSNVPNPILYDEEIRNENHLEKLDSSVQSDVLLTVQIKSITCVTHRISSRIKLCGEDVSNKYQ
jgi:hypothetical protein